jgi:phospholipid/cholesterol/gamma-HCH transport system substrate-binding protein
LEIRASYVIVGAVVLALLSALAAFSLWLVEAGVDRDDLARYEIAFAGSVSGLQQGGQVLYRGIPVGRVGDIRIDPDNVETVLVMVEVDRETPIKTDTVATLEFQGLTGIAYVQLRGGTQASARLDPNAKTPPRIASRSSALERVFESTPELLARTVAVVDRLGLLLTDENLEALAGTLRNVETVTAALADRSGEIDSVLAGAADMTGEIQGTAAEVRQLATDLRQLTGRLDQQVAGVGTDLGDTLTELRGAASSLARAAGQLEQMLGELEEPVDDFAATGLYEFTQLIGETRLLVAALSRITKEFERDPAGFLIGRSSRGYRAE